MFLLSSGFFGISVACTDTNNCVGKGLFGLDRLEKKKNRDSFFSLETVNDFDLEPDIYSTLFFFHNAKYAILYIFKIAPVSLEGQRVLEIYTEFC